MNCSSLRRFWSLDIKVYHVVINKKKVIHNNKSNLLDWWFWVVNQFIPHQSWTLVEESIHKSLPRTLKIQSQNVISLTCWNYQIKLGYCLKFEIVSKEVLWSVQGSYQTIWSPPLPNFTWHSGRWPYTVTPLIDQTLHQCFTLLLSWT